MIIIILVISLVKKKRQNTFVFGLLHKYIRLGNVKVPDGELKNCVLITSDLCRFKHAYCEINHICLMLRKKYTNRINNALRISSSLVYNNTITSYNTEVKKKKEEEN